MIRCYVVLNDLAVDFIREGDCIIFSGRQVFPEDPIVINASGDTFVRGGRYADENYGTNDSLAVDGVSMNVSSKSRIYIRFDGQVAIDLSPSPRIVLRIYGFNSSISNNLVLYELIQGS